MAFPITTQQGVEVQALIDAAVAYLQNITELTARQIIAWFNNDRPAIEGYDHFIWYRPSGSPIDPSTGPMRFGNKINFGLEINVSTRYMADGSQRDLRRATQHYVYLWRILVAFQGVNLFPATVLSPAVGGIWIPPAPASATVPPLSVQPMLIDVLPPDAKDQGEEGTIKTRLKATIPAVLALTITQ